MKKFPHFFCLLFLMLHAVGVAQEESDVALIQPVTSQDATSDGKNSPLMMLRGGPLAGARRVDGRDRVGEGRDPRNGGRDPGFDPGDAKGDDSDHEQRDNLNAQGGIAQRQGDQEERRQAVQLFPNLEQLMGREDRQQLHEGLAQDLDRAIARLRAMQQKTWLDHFMEAVGNPLRTLIKIKNVIAESISACWRGEAFLPRQRAVAFLRAQRERLVEIQREFGNQLVRVDRRGTLIASTMVEKINALEIQLNTWMAEQEAPVTCNQKAQMMLELVRRDYIESINRSELLDGDEKCINLNSLSWAYYLHENDPELLAALYQNLFGETYEALQLEKLQLLSDDQSGLSIDDQTELMKEALVRNLHEINNIPKYWMDFARFQNSSEELLRHIAYKIFDQQNEVESLNAYHDRPLTPPQLSYRLIGVVLQMAPLLNIPEGQRLDYCREWARSRQGRMSEGAMTTLLNEIRRNGPLMGLPLARPIPAAR